MFSYQLKLVRDNKQVIEFHDIPNKKNGSNSVF